ncbi:Penicillin-insensitive murein endopeptidase precursor [Pseudovibrio axinellae]|uniref:Penicillin-insensitive murein endopeptidase n=1 Tax=Pseudovibrio axinellae TaxID=989403 RepID=A0A161VCV3_9HYPH|nr:penicillin-insensitive murein endopeptidase [Pseudovibrio axinellae]KZL22064.1 Penicillin-insensitive murein endopeptidase precursor [Pseudovibrio axinellae]SEQ56627.1 murein endopeptidase. Metallo peptidase. MEROPS family M74 [Pseudovibrio axinellae]
MLGLKGLQHAAVLVAGNIMASVLVAEALAVPLPDTKPEFSDADYSKAQLKLLEFPGAAKYHFGKKKTPSKQRSASFGGYAKGCVAGAVAIPENGENWQVMRLSRNRNWGHPVLVKFLKSLAADAPALGWNGLLVGDMSQPRGGPMLSGHASHQIGLDADIWLRQMPNYQFSSKQRETESAVSMLNGSLSRPGADRRVNPKRWTDAHAKLIRRAAQDKGVARIFVNPTIKQALCKFETGERKWLRKIRPWWGHHYHFHVRMACPAGSKECKNQAAPPAGDGCGKELSYWLSDVPWVPKKPKPGEKPTPRKPKPALSVSDLPQSCPAVLRTK